MERSFSKCDSNWTLRQADHVKIKMKPKQVERPKPWQAEEEEGKWDELRAYILTIFIAHLTTLPQPQII